MSETQTSSSEQTQKQEPQPQPVARASKGPSTLQLAVVVAILGGGILVTKLTSDVNQVSEPGVRVEDGQPILVENAGEWTGGPLMGLTEDERRILPADTEGVRRVFTDKNGNQLYCSIVLAGRDVTSIHRPEVCLPGQGWRIQTSWAEPVETPAAPGGVLKVMRMNTVKDVRGAEGRSAMTRSIFLYWFVGKDRLTPHHWERILWQAKDRVLHNTNHRWAYILIHAPVTADLSPDGSGRSEQETMEMMASFVRDIYPTLVPN